MIICVLGDIMEQRGLTNKDVTELTKISRNTIKAFASNSSTRIDYETLNKLCTYLELEPGDILKFKKN